MVIKKFIEIIILIRQPCNKPYLNLQTNQCIIKSKPSHTTKRKLMKKLKPIMFVLPTVLAISACSPNSSMMDDLNSTSDSIARFASGTFSAQIDNTSVKSVYSATELAINNTNNYSIIKGTLNEKNAEITGSIKVEKSMFNKEGQTPYSIEIVKYNNSTVNIYIKIGTIGDKQSSVDLLSSIRTNLGI